ncbi:MAG: methionine ABC transporter permease [Tissierellia bacterium]|nr:methionine ABC transporter permease [Tissierellia bacterium]
MKELLIKATIETIQMVGLSTIISIILGFPIGILLVMTRKNGIAENIKLYSVLDTIINLLRSIPFIILMIVLFPISRIIVGTSIGTSAVIVPLSISAAPFIARMFEQTLLEVDKGVIDAAKAMGSTKPEIVFKVMIPEALPSLVNMVTITIINVIGYSAMAGAIGGGGLGDMAIRYGYFRDEKDSLWASVIMIVVLVQLVQFIGTKLSIMLNKR